MSETKQNNQIQERNEGMYPVGINGSWHGGIHFTPANDGWIEAMFSGEVMGGKIQKDYFKVRYLTEITLTEYDRLPNNEQELYTEKEKGIYILKDAAKPLEHKYSASYLIMEHSIEIPPADKSNTKAGQTSINFFTLYMHLRPFGEFEKQQMTEISELPFYLKWTHVEIKEVKNQITYYPINGSNNLYNSTKFLIKEGEYFHPNFNKKNLEIAIRQKRANSSVGGVKEAFEAPVVIPEDFVNGEAVKFTLKPKREAIPLYAPRVVECIGKFISNFRENKNFCLLGNIRADVNDYKVSYVKETGNIGRWRKENNLITIQVKDVNGRIIENQPTGIIDSDFITSGREGDLYTLKKDAYLFSYRKVDSTNGYKCVTVENFVKSRPQNSNLANKIVEVNGLKCIVLRLVPLEVVEVGDEIEIVINDVRIKKEKIIDFSLLSSDFSMLFNIPICSIKKYILRKTAFLFTGQRIQIKKATGTGEQLDIPKGYTLVQVYFSRENDYTEVLADASQFEIDGEVSHIFRIKDNMQNIQKEKGIPCKDKDGYITNILHEGDTFEIKRGSLSNGAEVEIHKIKGYSDSEAVRFITYNKNNHTLERNMTVNEKVCTKDEAEKETDVYRFKKNLTERVKTNQIIGKAGKFQSRDEYCHLEVFFKENKEVKDLFDGKYVHNRYRIKENAGLYYEEPPAGIQLFIPTYSNWEIEKGEKYSKLSLLKLRVYFHPDAIKENRESYYEIKQDTVCAYIYDNAHKITFGEIEDGKRVLFSEEESKSANQTEELYRYAMLLAVIIKQKSGDYNRENEDTQEPLEGKLKQGLAFRIKELAVEAPQLTFWINNEDANQFEKKDNEGNQKKKEGKITIFDGSEDPHKPVFKKIDTDKPEGALCAYGSLVKKTGRDGKTYCEFSEKGRNYYALEEDVITENTLDFGNKELNLFSSVEASSDEEVYCSEERINEMAGERVVYKDYTLFLPPEARERMRYLVSLFAMEWNKELYKLCGEDCTECTKPCSNDCKYYPREMYRAGHDWRYAPMKAEVMGKADVWNEVDILKKHEKKIWHIHPVKFYKHLDEVRLLNREVEILLDIQNRVVALECLKKGKKGMFGVGGEKATYCNHAVYLTIQALDGNYKQFIGYPGLYLRDDQPPSELKYLKEGDFKERHKDYKHKSTNIWFEILEEQANNFESGICRISPEEAQEKANLGYVVMAAWKNLGYGNENPPHYATVRPGFQYNSAIGPMVANVGKENNEEISTSKGFGESAYENKEIKFYYNRNQIFIYETAKIEKLERGKYL